MRHLLKSGAGATCTVTGTVSLNEAGPGPVQLYLSVKAALVPFVESLLIEIASKGARVNTVSPGSILEDGNT